MEATQSFETRRSDSLVKSQDKQQSRLGNPERLNWFLVTEDNPARPKPITRIYNLRVILLFAFSPLETGYLVGASSGKLDPKMLKMFGHIVAKDIFKCSQILARGCAYTCVWGPLESRLINFISLDWLYCKPYVTKDVAVESCQTSTFLQRSFLRSRWALIEKMNVSIWWGDNDWQSFFLFLPRARNEAGHVRYIVFRTKN